MEEQENKGGLKGFFNLGQVFGYYFRKKDPNQKADLNLRMMHGINKIAIIVFLLSVLFFVTKKIFFQ